MEFSSLVFILYFFPIAVFGYYIVPGKMKNIWLLIINLGFYAWGEKKYLLILLCSIVWNYFMARMMQCKYKKVCFIVGIVGNVGVLGLFKYFNFFVVNANRMGFGLQTIPWHLPVGLSFFTFSAIAYLADVYTEKIKAEKNIVDFGAYLSFFPVITSGPIIRFQKMKNQITERKQLMGNLCVGFEKFVVGLGKKLLLADTFAGIVDEIWTQTAEIAVFTAVIGAVGYMLQIYFDFSGYSDMALGLARMLGFTFEENFSWPYMSKTFKEFWRRWHISLGNWFRDYIYIPLGGSRMTTMRWIFNMLVVWCLTGIWHGAAWTFVLWGMLYFLVLVLERVLKIESRLNTRGKRVVYRIIVICMITLFWVVFRARSWEAFKTYMQALSPFNENGIWDEMSLYYVIEYWVLWLMGIIGTTPLIYKYVGKLKAYGKVWGTLFVNVCEILLFMVCIATIYKGTYNPFVYFNF